LATSPSHPPPGRYAPVQQPSIIFALGEWRAPNYYAQWNFQQCKSPIGKTPSLLDRRHNGGKYGEPEPFAGAAKNPNDLPGGLPL
jgi:hypothetical protein